jgi:hypothetical protein
MGAYLEALHHTGFYYTFIGVTQIITAILLIIPTTVTLGALLYFLIIINVWESLKIQKNEYYQKH